MEITSGLPGTGGWPLSGGGKDCLAEQSGGAGVDAGGGIAKVDRQAVAEACCQAKDPFLPGGAGQVAFVERVDRRDQSMQASSVPPRLVPGCTNWSRKSLRASQ